MNKLRVQKAKSQGNDYPLEVSGNFITTVPAVCPAWGQLLYIGQCTIPRALSPVCEVGIISRSVEVWRR